MKRFISFLVCTTVAGLCYVYSGVEAMETGYQIRKQQEEKTVILDRLRALNYNISQLKAPHNLERRLVAQRIVLESPKDFQKLTLPITVNPQNSSRMAAVLPHQPMLSRFFIGTARAEAKESSSSR